MDPSRKFLCVVGPPESGKSTILRAIAGVEDPVATKTRSRVYDVRFGTTKRKTLVIVPSAQEQNPFVPPDEYLDHGWGRGRYHVP